MTLLGASPRAAGAGARLMADGGAARRRASARPSAFSTSAAAPERCCRPAAAHPDWRLAGVDGSRGCSPPRAETGAANESLGAGPLPRPLPFREISTSSDRSTTRSTTCPTCRAGATVRAVSAVLRPGGLLVFDSPARAGTKSCGATASTSASATTSSAASSTTTLPSTPAAPPWHDQPPGHGAVVRPHPALLRRARRRDGAAGGRLRPQIVAPWSPIKKNSPKQTLVRGSKNALIRHPTRWAARHLHQSRR